MELVQLKGHKRNLCTANALKLLTGSQGQAVCRKVELRLLSDVNECVSVVADSMHSNRLQLNYDKTEFMWCTTGQSQHRLPVAGPTIGSFSVAPSSAVPDLGVYIDS